MNRTKKIIILLAVAMIITSFASIVNGATPTKLTVSVDKTEVQIGDEVTVTITSKEKIIGANFTIQWDHSVLEYSKAVGALGKNPEEGRFEWTDTDGLNEFQIVFKVIGTQGSNAVTVVPNKLTNGGSEDFEADSASVLSTTIPVKGSGTAQTPSTEPSPSEKPSSPTNPEPSAKPTPSSKPGASTGTNSTKTPASAQPDKMPQTGFNVAPILGFTTLIAVGVVMVLRTKKRTK